MVDPVRKPPTLADLDALPAHIKGEIIEGVLVLDAAILTPRFAA